MRAGLARSRGSAIVERQADRALAPVLDDRAPTAWPPAASLSLRSRRCGVTCSSGADIRARAAVSHAMQTRASIERPSGSARSPTTSSRKPSSTSSSTPSASCSRSASTSPTAGSTRRTTTRWPRRRGWPASWRSPPARSPHEHWFKLGRSLTPSGGVARAAVVERVDVRVPDAAARDAHLSGHAARTRPTARSSSGRSSTAQRRGVPWGISESAYNAQDLEGNYQYRAFGVPGLGLKRGLADDLVDRARTRASSPRRSRPTRCSPISSACAPQGLTGRYGFYEAIDYTADRLPKDHDRRRRRCPPTWRTTRA